jgi:hypothetical protein
MAPYTSSGVIGRPSLGSADKRKAILASLVQGFADVVDDLGFWLIPWTRTLFIVREHYIPRHPSE